MKKIFTLVLMLVAFTSFSQVRISQVYPGGGNSGATYNQDFVELYNAGSTPAAIGGYTIQYNSATGTTTTWSLVSTIATGTSIPAGGYLLISVSTTTATGIALPIIDIVGLTTFTGFGGTAGKVAIVNNSTLLIGNTTCTASNVVDLVGYGSTANCSEGNNPVNVTLTTTKSIIRGNNGCTDTNNNGADFTLVSVSPRNSATTTYSCISPTLTASSNITGLVTTTGVPSPSQSYNIIASNLTPAASSITITATIGLEISTTSSTTGFATTQTLAYTGGAITSTPIYVRIAATAAQGALTGATVTNAGGGATSAVVTVAGGVSKSYYSNATGALNVASTWGDNTMGTMNPPANFTTAYNTFNIVNRTTTMLSGPIDISGTGSKIIIGDGTATTTLTTNSIDSIKATNTVEVLNLGTLVLGNKSAPVFGTLASGSTVDYAFAGVTTADTVKVNSGVYHNLKLTNGLKFLKSGTTTVNGNLIMDGTASMNGAPNPFSTVILKGDLTMQNAAAMEDTSTMNGFANRFTLTLAGSVSQSINTNGSELRVFRIQKDTLNALTDLDIDVAGGSKILIGNNGGGDLKLTQKISGTPTITTLFLGTNAQIAFARNGFIFTDALGKAGMIDATNAKININKSVASTTFPGTLLFTPGSTLNELTVNITTTAKDTLVIGGTVRIFNVLNLTKGVIVVATGEKLEIADAAVVNGGSVSSYVDGAVRRFFDPMIQAVKLFPVGKNKQYSPVEITASAVDNYSVQYFKQSYSNTTVNSATTMAIPGYNVSTKEYWDIVRGDASSADIKFYYNNPSSGVLQPTLARIAHFNGTDWDDLGRDANGTDLIGNFVLKNNILDFSPFTFAGPSGVLPITLKSFTGSINNSTSTLEWTTACENIGDAFNLQYSKDGINFTNIYNTNSIGNCNGNIYKYIHTDASASVNYYRLALLDPSGRIVYSNIVVLKNGKNNFETKIISTNSNTQIAYSIASPTSGKGMLQITNLQGQKIYNQPIAYNNGYQINYINNAAWSNGLYFATFINENGEVSTLKFVK